MHGNIKGTTNSINHIICETCPLYYMSILYVHKVNALFPIKHADLIMFSVPKYNICIVAEIT